MQATRTIQSIKRSLITLWAAVCLAFAGALTTATAQEIQTASATTDSEKRFTIFCITWRGETDVEAGVRAYIEERNLPFDLIIRSAELDRSNIPALIEEARQLQPDLVYTWGTSVTSMTAGTHEALDPEKNILDIPIVFTMVTFPVDSGIVPSRESSLRNVTGVSHVVPMDTQIKAMRAYMPVDRVAVIYSPTESNSVRNVEELSQIGEELDFRVFKFPVPLDGSGKPMASAVPELVAKAAETDPQFLYLGPDSFVGANSEAITREANAAGLPTFTATERMIKTADALYGLVAPYSDVGRLTARKMEQILVEGRDPASIPIETLQRFSYQIKIDVARKLDIYPNMSLISYAEVVQ